MKCLFGHKYKLAGQGIEVTDPKKRYLVIYCEVCGKAQSHVFQDAVTNSVQ